MTKPLLHFAHANGVPSAVYGKMLHSLDDTFRLRMLPVLGTDPRYPVTDNWTHLVEQVADSVRAQCNEPVVGVGHSMGGLCTFMAAHRYPELFRAVVIMDPPVINGLGALSFWAMKSLGLIDRVTPAGKSAGRRETWSSRDEVRASLGRKKFFQAFDPDCFEDYLLFALTDDDHGVRLTVPVATEVAIFRTTPHDAWRYRRPLKVPGVLLSGAQSEFKGTGFAERLARHHHLLHENVEGGHMFPLEKPLLTASTVKRCLTQVGVLS
ncbi:MAG TPA: alpha/beta hydrolase [Moraxellaceae bacterium]|nr:alpha/beta hydrolase [Moraxellaceae bacterium]